MNKRGLMCLLLMAAFLILSEISFSAEDDKLLAEWKFDEAEGLVVKDSGKNGLDGKIINPENVKRVEGKSARLWSSPAPSGTSSGAFWSGG